MSGPRGTPPSRLPLEESSTQSHPEADRGVGRGPGGPPYQLKQTSGGLETEVLRGQLIFPARREITGRLQEFQDLPRYFSR